MKIRWILLMFFCLGVLAGCASIPSDSNSTAKTADDVVRQSLRFPEYFYMHGFQLNGHGRIPHTRVIGAGMVAKLDLATVRRQYLDLLSAHDWKTDKMEDDAQSFRIMASQADESVEIRAVQGTSGPTQIFLLYTPAKK